ncbi:MAG TPA: F0F1 ATP synthase subunit B [Rhodanobacteraceae bacterium]|nr:F0F1 ATP synthase subunit B [Rhodanobacteraceae bacterium]
MTINATLIAQMIVFLILIWITMKYIWPHLMTAMDERTRRISEGLSAAEKARKDLADADARVADEIRKARTEAAAIIDKAHQQAGQIVEKAKQDAIVEATRQKATAAADIESMAHRAREELRSQVASLAVSGAEKILKREIDANAHKALLDQLVAEMG